MGRAAEIKKIVAGTAREARATVKGASAQDGGAGAGPGGHAASSRRTSSAPPRGGPQPRGGAPDAPADTPLTNAPVFLSPAVLLLSPAQSVSAGRKGPTWAARGRADLPLRARPGVSVCVCVCGHLSGCHPVREAGPLVLARPTRGSGCGHSLSPPLCFMSFTCHFWPDLAPCPHGIGVGLVLQGASEEVEVPPPTPGTRPGTGSIGDMGLSSCHRPLCGREPQAPGMTGWPMAKEGSAMHVTHVKGGVQSPRLTH